MNSLQQRGKNPTTLDCPKNPGTPCRCKQPEKRSHRWLSEFLENRQQLYQDDPLADPSKFVPYIMQKKATPGADTSGFLPLKYMQAQ